MKKRFSIVIPVFNREKYVRKTIDSALAQTYTNYEIIVVNDGSTDQTQNILDSFGQRITVITQSNQGAEAARYRGTQEAKGEYIAFLDSDDLLLPNALEIYDLIVRKFQQPSLILGAMTRTDTERIDEVLKDRKDHGNAVTVVKYRDFLSKESTFSYSFSKTIILKSVIDTLIQMDKEAGNAFPFDDVDLLLRSGTCEPCIIVAHPETVLYRIHQGNVCNILPLMGRGILYLIKSEGNGRYPGGKKRRFDRYARIGGQAYTWGKTALQKKHLLMAIKIFARGWPMVLAAIASKYRSRRQKNEPFAFSLNHSDAL